MMLVTMGGLPPGVDGTTLRIRDLHHSCEVTTIVLGASHRVVMYYKLCSTWHLGLGGPVGLLPVFRRTLLNLGLPM